MPNKNSAGLKETKWWHWLVILFIIFIITSSIGSWYQLYYNSNWDGRSRLNFIVVNSAQQNHLQIFSYENLSDSLTKEPQAVIIDLPPEVRLEVVQGYDQYLVSALYGLADQEQNITLLTDTLQQELGIPIDGWLASSADKCDSDNLPNCLLNQIKWWTPYLPDTNFNRGDLARLWWQIRRLRTDQIRWLDFSLGNWAKTELEIDGQPVIWFDKNTIDSQIPELLADSQVKHSPHAVRVVNTTNIPGLGSEITRVISGMGARVIEVTNRTENINTCQIQTTSSAKSSYLVQRLVKIFDCHLSDQLLDDPRVDIEVLVSSN